MRTQTISLFILVLLIIVSILNCSSGAYQDWYAEEGQEEDMLSGMFNESDYYAEETSQPITSGRWDDWYNEGDSSSGQTTQSDTQASSVKSKTEEQSLTSQYSPEFKLRVVKEIKIPDKNQIKLILENSVRIPEIEDMSWKRVKSSRLEQIYGDVVLQNSKETSLRKDGLFEVTLSPANADDYFAFVPLHNAGISAPGFTPPLNSLDLKSITFSATSATNQSYNCQHTVQTYNIKTVAKAFAHEVLAPHIQNLQIFVIDSETQYPISDAVVTLTGNAPSPLKALSPFISDTELLLHAIKSSPTFVVDQSRFTTTLSGASINCYSPNHYNLHIMHPNYYYYSGGIEITDSSHSLTYSLSRRAEDVRILSNADKLTPVK